MLMQQVALVSEVPSISLAQVANVSAALQKQAMRDLGPIWGVQATVDAVASLEDVPLGYWPIIIVEDVKDAAGYHQDQNGQPYALVEAGPTWSLTASHECLEMLVDPFGNRLIAGPSVKKGQGRVRYLAEVCDPSESEAFAYTVNNVLVSDFYTPHFFDPVLAAGVRYSYTSAIKAPRQVLAGGYLSWHDPATNHWWQKLFFNGKQTFKDLGVFELNGRSIRSVIDELSPNVSKLSKISADNPVVAEADAVRAETAKATNAKGVALRAQIQQMLAAK
jgi:hypothetical protein